MRWFGLSIVSVLQRHGIRVVVANTRKLRSITVAKAMTDRLDARTLARLLASGLLERRCGRRTSGRGRCGG
jgi:transposase